MSLVEHAERELTRINEDPALAQNVVATVAKFAEFGHSGGSAPIAIHYLTKLLNFEPLSPLTSDPDEWIDRTEMSGSPMWQSSRDSRAFSTDGGKTWYLLGDEDNAAEVEGDPHMPDLTTAQRLAAYRDELLAAGFAAMEVCDLVHAAAPAQFEDVEVQADLDDPGTTIGEVRVHLRPVLDEDDVRRVVERAHAAVEEATSTDA